MISVVLTASEASEKPSRSWQHGHILQVCGSWKITFRGDCVCRVVPTQVLLGTRFLAFQGLWKELRLIGSEHSDFLRRSFKSKRLNVSVGNFFQSAWEIWEHEAPCKAAGLHSSILLGRGLWAAYPKTGRKYLSEQKVEEFSTLCFLSSHLDYTDLCLKQM